MTDRIYDANLECGHKKRFNDEEPKHYTKCDICIGLGLKEVKGWMSFDLDPNTPREESISKECIYCHSNLKHGGGIEIDGYMCRKCWTDKRLEIGKKERN